ncbi:Hypothetical predicted protein [Octopus vulgaris]|uniref:Uncharacterized protein n=1 Tax=Octopus vulgaris TaxID=6645 RepID=A0AA36F917_OCTVU|nr:Hypothetical predicted protein [Octopus vulgaris]
MITNEGKELTLTAGMRDGVELVLSGDHIKELEEPNKVYLLAKKRIESDRRDRNYISNVIQQEDNEKAKEKYAVLKVLKCHIRRLYLLKVPVSKSSFSTTMGDESESAFHSF